MRCSSCQRCPPQWPKRCSCSASTSCRSSGGHRREPRVLLLEPGAVLTVLCSLGGLALALLAAAVEHVPGELLGAQLVEQARCPPQPGQMKPSGQRDAAK